MYATQQDLESRYGEKFFLLAADRNGNGHADPTAVEDALQDATDEIDSYVATRYALPLSPVPGVLKRTAADIAMYRLCPETHSLNDETRQRYKDAVAWLSRVASGEVSLGAPDRPLSGHATIVAPPRRFTRKKMGGLL